MSPQDTFRCFVCGGRIDPETRACRNCDAPGFQEPEPDTIVQDDQDPQADVP